MTVTFLKYNIIKIKYTELNDCHKQKTRLTRIRDSIFEFHKFESFFIKILNNTNLRSRSIFKKTSKQFLSKKAPYAEAKNNFQRLIQKSQ